MREPVLGTSKAAPGRKLSVSSNSSVGAYKRRVYKGCVNSPLWLCRTWAPSHLSGHHVLASLDVEQPLDVVGVGLHVLHPRGHASLLVSAYRMTHRQDVTLARVTGGLTLSHCASAKRNCYMERYDTRLLNQMRK